jgi:hypothetical protein
VKHTLTQLRNRSWLRLVLLRWAAVGSILLVFVVYIGSQVLEPENLHQINWLSTGLFALFLAGLAFLVAGRWVQQVEAFARLRRRYGEIKKQATNANQRLEAVLQLNKKIVAANDEKEIIDLVLHLAVDSVGALGASFVPYDERGQPLTAITYGESPAPVFNTWVEYLASPSVRHRCPTCQGKESDSPARCCRDLFRMQWVFIVYRCIGVSANLGY